MVLLKLPQFAFCLRVIELESDVQEFLLLIDRVLLNGFRRSRSHDTDGGDFENHAVLPGLHVVKLGRHGTSRDCTVAAVMHAAEEIVARALLVDPEVHGVHVAAGEAIEVSLVRLGEDDDQRPALGDGDFELGVEVVDRPRHVDACPLLGDFPLLVEEPHAIDVWELLEEVFVGYPENTVVAECVVQFGH